MRAARFALMVMLAACSWEFSPEQAEVRPRESYVGELERLGPDGQDFLVLGVGLDGFEDLTLEQKKLAYFLYRAAIAGHHIFTDQTHCYALELKNLLEQIFLHSEGLPSATVGAVHDYLKYVWINHGQYGARSHAKYVPNSLTSPMLKEAAQHAAGQGADLGLGTGEDLPAKLERLRAHIFDADFEPLQTNQKEGDDILATSFVNLYHPEITLSALGRLSLEWQQRLNVFFDLQDGTIAPRPYGIGGLYSEDLETVSYWLREALALTESEQQQASIQALLDYYQSGEEGRFRDHSVAWLKSKATIDYLNGFIEQYYDPRGVIGQFEANVSFLSDSKLISSLAASAEYFERRMPWPDLYKRTQVTPPVSTVVQVIVETGDSGPTSPVAYNLPNYADIRRDVGSKNVVLLNIQEARSERIEDEVIREFYLPRFQEGYRKYGRLGRQWGIYMHEVIGHGSGRPAETLKGDPRALIGRAFSSLEECRADLVGLYHVFDPKLVEIGAFSAEEQTQVAEALYIGHLQGQMNRYRSLETDIVREAHRKGRELILQYLVRGGEEDKQDFGTRVTQVEGNYFVEILDLQKARQGIAQLLGRLQVIKSTGDAEAAARLFDRFGTRVNTAWRENIRKRSERLKLPREAAFVFPQLVPVLDGEEIVDVAVEIKEDLTRQQLRFSRWRFNRELWPELR